MKSVEIKGPSSPIKPGVTYRVKGMPPQASSIWKISSSHLHSVSATAKTSIFGLALEYIKSQHPYFNVLMF